MDPSPEENDGTMVFSPQKKLLSAMLFGVLLLLLVVLIAMMWPTLMYYYRRLVPVSKKHIARRKQTIQSWTITKTIRDHARCQNMQRRNGADERSVGTPYSENEAQCCLICLELFREHETVSWSSTMNCDHAFHPACIESWLLRHVDCPCCRRMYLLVDYTRKKIPSATLKDLIKKRKRRSRSTYFCIMDGLVTMESSSHLERSLSDLEAALGDKEIGDTVVTAPTIEEKEAPGLFLPFRRLFSSLESSGAAQHNESNGVHVEEAAQEHDGGVEESRVIRTKESTETDSTTPSTTVSTI